VAAGLTTRTSLLGRLLAVALVAGLAGAACGIGATRSPRVTPPVVSPSAGAPVSAAVAEARAAIVQALGGVGLFLDEPHVPYRPAEAPSLASSPRTIFQAVLPDDPGHGFIAVYELPSVPEAEVAAEEQAAYVTSGPGRVQFPPDTQFVIRRLGTTVMFHAYSGENSTDRRAAEVVVALRRLGDEVPIPR
jgi:hypothetical protein